jgi:hypothetical protein
MVTKSYVEKLSPRFLYFIPQISLLYPPDFSTTIPQISLFAPSVSPRFLYLTVAPEDFPKLFPG